MKSWTSLLLIVLVSLTSTLTTTEGFSVKTPKSHTVVSKNVDVVPENIEKAVETKIRNAGVWLAPVIAATTALPAWAKKEEVLPPPDYLGQSFNAAFLPAILVPVVGIVLPAFAFSLFFIWTQLDDIE